jgi:hypothetical protein
MTLAVLTIACTPFSEAQLDDWFVYHPPTDDQVDHYKAVAESFAATSSAINDALTEWGNARAGAEAEGVDTRGFRAPHDTFTKLSWHFRRFAEVIGAHCPDGADKMAAIRSLRLARNAINDTLCGANDLNYRTMAREQLRLARYQASAAIACLWRPPAVAREHGAVQALALEIGELHEMSRARDEVLGVALDRHAVIINQHADRLLDLDARIGEFDGKVFDAEEILPGGPGPEANEALGIDPVEVLGGVDGDVVVHDTDTDTAPRS